MVVYQPIIEVTSVPHTGTYEHLYEISPRRTHRTVLGILHIVLSSMASMDSAPSLLQPHLPLEEPNLLVWLLPRPQIPRNKFLEPLNRSSGAFVSSTLSTFSSSALLYPQTVRFTLAREAKVVIHHSSLLSNWQASRHFLQSSTP